jgi:methionyl-tRNA formyltransferase
MKTILVTSELTFVPENYDHFVLKMAENPHIIGLIVLKNRELSFLAIATYFLSTRAAPMLGKQVIKNYFSSFSSKRTQVYQKFGKKIWYLDSINSPEALKIIADEKADLVINSRTRFIYKKAILRAPRFGCINIHHGLLPNQRGLMCDFWAHLENEDFGFSIHRMTSKIDDGDILKVVKVTSPRTSYVESLLLSSIKEAETCAEVLNEIEQKQNDLMIIKNSAEQAKYRTNPGKKDLLNLQKKGIKV